MQNNSLPKDFVTVDEAIKLINSETRGDAKLNISLMAKKTIWLEANHNFRLPRIKPKKDEDGNVIGFIPNGSYYVSVDTVRDAENLKYAILTKFRELAKKEFVEETTRGVSTVADDAEGIAAVQPRRTKGNRKKGDNISGDSSSPITSNGEGINV